jgi:hypothetical protein
MGYRTENVSSSGDRKDMERSHTFGGEKEHCCDQKGLNGEERQKGSRRCAKGVVQHCVGYDRT